MIPHENEGKELIQNLFFSPSPKHAKLQNGSTFSPQGGGRSPRWAGVSLGGRDPLSSFPRCALQTESGTQYCTLRHSKSQIWHFFRGQNLALFGSKNLYLVINGQYWLMKFPAGEIFQMLGKVGIVRAKTSVKKHLFDAGSSKPPSRPAALTEL